MICRNCLRAASRTQLPASSIRQSQRFLTTSSALHNATPISATTATQTAPRQGSSTSSHTPPTATSTSAAQPFSEPLTPAASPDLKAQAAKVAEKKAAPLVKSSIPAGQPLKGLNFLKNAQDPVALPDDEYPSWLWTILDRQEKKAETGAGDLFCTFDDSPYIYKPPPPSPSPASAYQELQPTNNPSSPLSQPNPKNSAV